jgi:choline-sulfatase
VAHLTASPGGDPFACFPPTGPPAAWSRCALRGLAVLAVLATGLAGCGPHRTEAGAAGPPNLLLVTVDTLRADRVGAYGGAAGTPALDRLAREGVRFATASAAAPLTLPSHATILSGLLPPHHGLRDNGAGRFPEDRPTLATLLAGAGYRTGAFVSAFVLDRRFGLARGFEVYDDEVERSREGVAALESERRGDRTVDRALAWLAGSAGGDRRPFFLWVHLYDPHFPYRPPEPYRSRSPGGGAHSAYDGEVAFADAQVGRLLDALDRRGLAGRTVVAAAADHGEALGEHGEPTHGLFLYESTLRVPLLLRLPGRPGGRTVTTPVSLADLAPTLAGLLGRDLRDAAMAPGASGAGGRLDGRDLAADLAAGREPAPADLYAETRYPRIFGWSGLASLRRRDLKYIAAPRPELYDLARDPGETSDLAAVPKGTGAARPETRGFAERLAAITAIEAAAVAPAPGATPDEETRRRLASLGYAAPTVGAAPAGPRADAGLPDPKDRVDLFRRYEQAHAALDEENEGDMAGAAPELAALVAADPANPVFRARLAELRRRQGDAAEAAALYRQAVAAAPEDADAWYNLGMTLSEAGEAGEARTALERTLSLDPGRAEAHNALGILETGAGRAEGARAEFERATQLDPKSGHAWNNLGNALRTLGRPAEAAAAYRRATAVAPRYAEPWNGLGALEVERDRPVQALSFFDRALALAPGYHEVRLNRAIALEMAGDAAGARAGYRDFLEAVGRDPQFEAQRRAARQLLARLSDREAGTARPERR